MVISAGYVDRKGAPTGPYFIPVYAPAVLNGFTRNVLYNGWGFYHPTLLLQDMTKGNCFRYSRKEYCELCGHKFSFTPIYSPDMPRRLPVKDLVSGLLSSVGTAVKYWLHYTLVALAWLGVVPLTACRIYRALFAGLF